MYIVSLCLSQYWIEKKKNPLLDSVTTPSLSYLILQLHLNLSIFPGTGLWQTWTISTYATRSVSSRWSCWCGGQHSLCPSPHSLGGRTQTTSPGSRSSKSASSVKTLRTKSSQLCRHSTSPLQSSLFCTGRSSRQLEDVLGGDENLPRVPHQLTVPLPQDDPSNQRGTDDSSRNGFWIWRNATNGLVPRPWLLRCC